MFVICLKLLAVEPICDIVIGADGNACEFQMYIEVYTGHVPVIGYCGVIGYCRVLVIYTLIW